MNSVPISDSTKSSTECTSLESSKLPRGLVGMKGLPIAKGTRLPSLRGPRDLTLGGAVKRVFTPNVSQCKERNKNNDNATNLTIPEKSGKNKERAKQHAYRRSKSRKLIQTQGVVFDEGPVDLNTKPEIGCQLFRKGYSKSEKKALPKFVPKLQNRNEDKEMQELLRDDFIEDNEDIDEKLFPTILPISSKSEIFHQNFKKKWVRIMAEQDENEDFSESNLNKENKSLDRNNANKSRQMPLDIFSTDNVPESGKLLFFQFPDCLPGLKEKSDTTVKMDSVLESPGFPQKKKGNVRKKETAASSSTLADWPEGYLGKLRIHKSGKSYLVIGSLILDINISTSVGFLQELVSLRIKKNGGDMTVLGHVSEKVVCVPSTEALLASCS